MFSFEISLKTLILKYSLLCKHIFCKAKTVNNKEDMIIANQHGSRTLYWAETTNTIVELLISV